MLTKNNYKFLHENVYIADNAICHPHFSKPNTTPLLQIIQALLELMKTPNGDDPANPTFNLLPK